MEAWPQSIDYLLDRGSFTIDPNDSVTRTEFDDGPVMVRMRFSNPTTIYNGTLTLTNNEFITFRGFYQNILKQGTAWFTMPLWIGNEYTIQKARFKKTYEVSDQGFDQYAVTISLEVRDYFTFDYFASYILGFFGLPAAITEVADPLQIIVNVDYPEVMYLYQFPDYVRWLFRYFGISTTINDMEIPVQEGVNITYSEIMSGGNIIVFTDTDGIEYIATFNGTDVGTGAEYILSVSDTDGTEYILTVNDSDSSEYILTVNDQNITEYIAIMSLY